jgi:hypothetical protein
MKKEITRSRRSLMFFAFDRLKDRKLIWYWPTLEKLTPGSRPKGHDRPGLGPRKTVKLTSNQGLQSATKI